MTKITAIYGSPRHHGNTATLLKKAVEGAREAGAEVTEFVLRDLEISPCLELYTCRKDGRCPIQDDFQKVADSIMESQGLMLASPIFFYAVSAHTKAFMDRCQSLWVKKHWIDKVPLGHKETKRKGLFIAVGATKGKQLFDGVLLSIRYLFDALDAEMWRSLLYRGLDLRGDVDAHPEYLGEAYQAGKDLCQTLSASSVI